MIITYYFIKAHSPSHCCFVLLVRRMRSFIFFIYVIKIRRFLIAVIINFMIFPSAETFSIIVVLFAAIALLTPRFFLCV